MLTKTTFKLLVFFKLCMKVITYVHTNCVPGLHMHLIYISFIILFLLCLLFIIRSDANKCVDLTKLSVQQIFWIFFSYLIHVNLLFEFSLNKHHLKEDPIVNGN